MSVGRSVQVRPRLSIVVRTSSRGDSVIEGQENGNSSKKGWFLSEVHVSSNRKREYGLDLSSNGNLVLVPQQAESVGGLDGTGNIVSQVLDQGTGLIKRTLFPEGGKDAVTEDYWSFSFWSFIKSAVSASTSVLGTQGLLRAVGVGANASVASSAAINWVLKDGLGRIGCILAASIIGNKFDNDAKLFVFLGDMMYEVGIFLEILAPLCAHVFLIVASVANAFKSMSYMSRLPPRAAILKSFATRENVGDVSAKANSQDVVSGLFGLLLGIQVSFFVGSSIWKSLVVFLVSSTIVAIASLKAVDDLRLNTLNRHRMEILLDTFVTQNMIPSPQVVNKKEGTLASWTRGNNDRDFSVVFGASLKSVRSDCLESFGALIEYYKEEEYILSLQQSKNKKKLQALLFVQPDISAKSIILALLQVAYIKDRFLQFKAKGKKEDFDTDAELKTSFRLSKSIFPKMYEELQTAGWFTKHILWIPKHLLQLQQRKMGYNTNGANDDAQGSGWQVSSSSHVIVQPETRDTTCNSPVCETPTVVEVSAAAAAAAATTRGETTLEEQ